MSGFRRPELSRDQIVLWSQRLEDALPPDHPVRLFDQLLHAEPFAAAFRERERDYVLVEGQPPYHPRDLAALYLYGMMTRLRSSRQLEAACWNRLDVIWLMQCRHPDHATVAGFVSRHGKRLRKLFRDLVHVWLPGGPDQAGACDDGRDHDRSGRGPRRPARRRTSKRRRRARRRCGPPVQDKY